MTSYSLKRVASFVVVSLLIRTGFCQSTTTFGLIFGSGLPKLSIGYTIPNWNLGGVTLLKPLSLGIYGEHHINKQFKTGLDLTYYRLPLNVSDGLGKSVFQETFNYLSIAPYVAYEPVKWISVAFNLSGRHLLNYKHEAFIFSPSQTILLYYGPRLTVKPVKQLCIDLGYETYSRSFAVGHIGLGPSSLSNSTVYANIRFILYTKYKAIRPKT
jgi:hypothetical protein